jgi:hypothetical protein
MEDRMSDAISNAWRPETETIKNVLVESDALARLTQSYPEYETTWAIIALDLQQRARRAVRAAEASGLAKIDLAA